MKKKKHRQSLNQAIDRGLATIRDMQMPNGSFYSLSGDKTLVQTTESQTVFHTPLILECLKDLKDNPIVETMAKKGCAFLLRQRNLNWTWTYWQDSTSNDLPPDLDDTSTALNVLSIYGQGAVDGVVLASFAKHLIHAEAEVGGPYNTWILPRFRKEPTEAWNDVDVVVNANIKNFLKTENIDLPNITKKHEAFIRDKNITSKYYYADVVTLYFIARTYRGRLTRRIAMRILSHRLKNGLWESDLETALAVSTLLKLNFPIPPYQKAINHLIAIGNQKKFVPSPLYIEERFGTPTYSGSSALTAAYIVEALTAYKAAIKPKNLIKTSNKHNAFHMSVLQETHTRFAHYSADIQVEMKNLVQKVVDTDRDKQITLLPYHFACALTASAQCSEADLRTLGVANLLGWVGYRVYDHILDQEGGGSALPVATIALRHVASIYRSFFSAKQFQLFERIMDTMDAANDWEHRYAYYGIHDGIVPFHHLPNYHDHHILSNKSLGHALGPIAILLKMGYTEHSPEVRGIQDFFHHYLIARQMNDDAHDWYKDLKRGFVNSASTLTLHSWARRNARGCIYHHLPLSENEEALHSIFWTKSMLAVSNTMKKHLKAAHSALKKNPAFKTISYFEGLLKPLQRSVENALVERKKMLEFIEAY